MTLAELLNPLARTRVVLATALSPEECERRLRANFVSWRMPSAWLPFATGPEEFPVAGRVTRRGFAVRKFIRYGNSFQPTARGELVPVPEGTRIPVTVGLSRLTLAFGAFWVGFATLFLVGVIWTLLMSPARASNDPMLVLVPLGMLGVFYAMAIFGRFLARGHTRFLLSFLLEHLDAREVHH